MQFKFLDKEVEKMNQTTRREVVVAFLMRTVQAYIQVLLDSSISVK